MNFSKTHYQCGKPTQQQQARAPQEQSAPYQKHPAVLQATHLHDQNHPGV